ncbi:MAG: lasso peptide biosynthesis B2 protein [Sterolibacteriaceae bacterium]|uniref:Lasso peptide biosynthesis B2 protein n=1 Tax=Candidatus Methylophosphatis roskildensis TaxID=2899263 RepID=A0A9D7E2S0_9PROT|nr:lasso peptide biosynthesis B2 protein [Candidatus Methylophosphatis roskildensis]MBK7665100.1 lasso peptide biosynthesis B2 protein [Sterolibacteriaceae bacterium]MBK9085358.1 lasso peptide biosynthesis B2 protein [Sterolibacteriaceae bacterium]
MDRIRKFLRLPSGEQWQVCKATLLLLSVRFLLRVLPFPTVRPFLAKACRGSKGLPQFSAKKLAWSVATAGRFVPGGKHCLSQAITLQIFLTRRSYDSRVCFGVQRHPGAPFMAHAWVEHDGEVLIGGENLGRFVRLTPRSHSATGSGVLADPFA